MLKFNNAVTMDVLGKEYIIDNFRLYCQCFLRNEDSDIHNILLSDSVADLATSWVNLGYNIFDVYKALIVGVCYDSFYTATYLFLDYNDAVLSLNQFVKQ